MPCVSRVVADRAAQRDAVHARHHHVHDDEIGLQAADLDARVVAVAGLLDPQSPARARSARGGRSPGCPARRRRRAPYARAAPPRKNASSIGMSYFCEERPEILGADPVVSAGRRERSELPGLDPLEDAVVRHGAVSSDLGGGEEASSRSRCRSPWSNSQSRPAFGLFRVVVAEYRFRPGPKQATVPAAPLRPPGGSLTPRSAGDRLGDCSITGRISGVSGQATRRTVAQLDRATGYEPVGRGFESLRSDQWLGRRAPGCERTWRAGTSTSDTCGSPSALARAAGKLGEVPVGAVVVVGRRVVGRGHNASDSLGPTRRRTPRCSRCARPRRRIGQLPSRRARRCTARSSRA